MIDVSHMFQTVRAMDAVERACFEIVQDSLGIAVLHVEWYRVRHYEIRAAANIDDAPCEEAVYKFRAA